MIQVKNASIDPLHFKGVTWEQFQAQYAGKISADLADLWSKIQAELSKPHQEKFCESINKKDVRASKKHITKSPKS